MAVAMSHEDEPEAPTLSLGDRVLWKTQFQSAFGTVRWIGRIPQLSPGWSAGVEFDHPMPDGGNGTYRGRKYFSALEEHVHFLSLSELIKEEFSRPNISPHRSSHSSQYISDLGCHNSYHFMERQRDATYGNFRHKCQCSSCVRDVYQHCCHYYDHAPIYGHISSRRSLYHEDHPYESYHSQAGNHLPKANHIYEETNHNIDRVANNEAIRSPCYCSDYSTLPRSYGRKYNNQALTSYSNDVAGSEHSLSNKTVFNPKSTVNLISGLKEWVSCWVLGATKKKKTTGYIIKGRKTVTSVVVSPNSQSITGARLSSFSQYSNANDYERLVKNQYYLQGGMMEAGINCDIGTANNTLASTKTDDLYKLPEAKSIRRKRKKRPAPLPPALLSPSSQCTEPKMKGSTFSTTNVGGSCTKNVMVKKDQSKFANSSSNMLISDKKNDRIISKNNSDAKVLVKRKTPKKNPAPPPPVSKSIVVPVLVNNISNEMRSIRAEGSSVYLAQHINCTKNDSTCRQMIHLTQAGHSVTGEKVENKIGKEKETMKSKRNETFHKQSHFKNLHNSENYIPCDEVNINQIIDTVKNEKYSESDSENYNDSRRQSVSFSGDDSEDAISDWITDGIITYQHTNKNDSLSDGSKHQIPNDVCLKISIKKTETNVFTVEEVPPVEAQDDDYDDDDGNQSSLSEHSSVIKYKDIKLENSIVSEQKQSTSEESLEMVNESEHPNTIFEELNMKKPTKGSVKDFVYAFNMLADRGNTSEIREKKLGLQAETKKFEPKTNKMAQFQVKEDFESNINNIKSFPTKWQYQTNSIINCNYSNNNILQPIEEESHTENSEQHDICSSNEELNISSTSTYEFNGKLNNSQEMNNQEHSNIQNHELLSTVPFQPLNAGDVSKTCSYCSEEHQNRSSPAKAKHLASERTKRISMLEKKNTGLVKNSENEKHLISSRGIQFTNVPTASEAALAVLLSGKTFEKVDNSKDQAKCGNIKSKADKGAKTKKIPSSKNSNSPTNKDQAIMVSLYIEDKSSHRGPIPFVVTTSMTLRKLKIKVEKEYKFPRDLQFWILNKSFAIEDDATLLSYGVTETGCPILLYVMAKESKSKSLPSRHAMRSRRHIYADVPFTSSDSEEDEENSKKISLISGDSSNNKISENSFGVMHSKLTSALCHMKNAGKISQGSHPKHPFRHPRFKQEKYKSRQKSKSDFHAAWEKEYLKKKDYHALMELDDLDLVTNIESFECPVCFMDIGIGDGAVLQDCLHTFCKDCLANTVQFSEGAIIKCPFRNDEYSCESHLQEREIKSLITPEAFERYLQRSMALAESQAQNSFHCKTPDCPGWCLFEDNVNTFHCPVCKHVNCLTCTAIHEGSNCRQYQDDLAFRCDSSEEAKRTKEYLDKMLDDGDALKCPQCHVILMKKWGCDWLKCSMCHTEVCWVTKGPRWGPGGRGDTSGGCKCMLNGIRCHPKCNYCH